MSATLFRDMFTSESNLYPKKNMLVIFQVIGPEEILKLNSFLLTVDSFKTLQRMEIMSVNNILPFLLYCCTQLAFISLQCHFLQFFKLIFIFYPYIHSQ